MNLSPRARELLALQHKKYLQSLPDKKARISRRWSEIQRQGWSPELSARFKTEVHRLSGSAGSYGLDALGRAAHQLDLFLVDNPGIESSVTGPKSGSGSNTACANH